MDQKYPLFRCKPAQSCFCNLNTGQKISSFSEYLNGLNLDRYCIQVFFHDKICVTWLLGNVPSLSMALTLVTMVPIGSPSRTRSCSRSVKSGISSFTSSNTMKMVASLASCWAPLFWNQAKKFGRRKNINRNQKLTGKILDEGRGGMGQPGQWVVRPFYWSKIIMTNGHDDWHSTFLSFNPNERREEIF